MVEVRAKRERGEERKPGKQRSGKRLHSARRTMDSQGFFFGKAACSEITWWRRHGAIRNTGTGGTGGFKNNPVKTISERLRKIGVKKPPTHNQGKDYRGLKLWTKQRATRSRMKKKQLKRESREKRRPHGGRSLFSGSAPT